MYICNPKWDLQTNLHPPLRQLLRIKTGAAALESLTFADVEAQKLADSVEEVPHRTFSPRRSGFPGGWRLDDFFSMRPQ